MSASVPAVLRALATLACAVSLVLIPATAQAASPSRDVEFDVPSLLGNVDTSKVTFNDDTTKLTAWVRLPAGYDEQPGKRWPVLYLLHGWEDSSDGWLDPKKGNLDGVLPADFPGIVVMPEGGKEWFINWYDSAHNAGHQWGNYLLDEVVPFMESHLRILPGRSNHAIGGLSMGGYGSLRAAAAMPTYFGSAYSFSGLVNPQDPTFSQILNAASVGRPGYGSIFGPITGAYATTMNPLKFPRDLAADRLSVYYGTPSVSFIWSLDIRVHGLATLEIGAQLEAKDLLKALGTTGAQVYTTNTAGGSHDWPWWKQYLANAVSRGLWADTPVMQTSQNRYWSYDTMASHGNAWGLGFQMATAPTSTVTLTRAGSQLYGTGSGTIRISGGAADADDSGNGTLPECTFTLKLPFQQTLPASC